MAVVDRPCKDRCATSEQPVVQILIGIFQIAVMDPALPRLLPHLEYKSRITSHDARRAVPRRHAVGRGALDADDGHREFSTRLLAVPPGQRPGQARQA
jgi:hypothetical protein